MHHTLGFIARSFTEGVLECNGMLNDDFTLIITHISEISSDIKTHIFGNNAPILK